MGDDTPTRDPFRWLGAPQEDRSLDAEFRREVEVLARRLLTSDGKALASSGGAGSQAGDGGLEGPSFSAAESFDVRAGTPDLLIRAHRTLTRRLGGDVNRDMVLLELARRGAVSPGGLGRRLDLAKSTLASVVGSGVEAGLITRSRGVRDRRRRVLRLTPEGRRAAVKAAARWRGADDSLLNRLTPGERDELRRLLWKLSARADGRALDMRRPPA